MVRWSTILLQQFFVLFCFVNGRLHFPFASELYNLFFERFHSTRMTLIHDLPPRPREDARMHMWGQLLPKRGQSELLCGVDDKDVCDLLAEEDEHDVLDFVLYPYAGIYWRGFENIQFTKDEPPDDRGNIIVIF